MTQTSLDLIVTRANLSEVTVTQSPLPDPLADGTCLLRIDGFALTANNITYGVAGDQLGYWDFFPTESPDQGRIPVWGFATVVASAHPQIDVGERVYGYVPMSTYLVVQPGKITPFGFTDIAPHRAERAPIYNAYAFTRTDAQWQGDHEPLISLFRPLFTTSFLLEDLHRENTYFGAEQVVLSSASSKTAIGLAVLLSKNCPAGVSVVGLTSTGNRAFVQGLGSYDQVLCYDEVCDLTKRPSAYVDMAGNAELRSAVHHHLGDLLTSSRAVGMTHWQDSGGLGGDLPGPRPEFFFAPSYAQERLAVWGPAGFQTRLGEAWTGFLADAQGWVQVKTDTGSSAVEAAYRKMLEGQIDPSEGLYLSMHPAA